MKMINTSAKLSGFTLLELIIVMVISATVITLIFIVFSNVRTAWSSFYIKQEKVKSLLFFKKTIENDIEQAEVISAIDEKGGYVMTINGNTVNYSFDSIITREQQGRVDSFPVIVKNVRANYVRGISQMKIVNQITLDIVGPINLPDVCFIKQYTSGDLVPLINKE